MSPDPFIPIARPWMADAEISAAGRVIRSGWVTQGPEVAAFEREFADVVSAPHACAVANCTVALHLALRAVGVGPGDEVITVSHSFIATANAVRYCGATPVFVDVQPSTYNIDPELIERVVSPRTRAILCVHQIGMPCDLERIVAIGQRHGVAVIEDAACAIGSEVSWEGQWQRIGRPHGDIACFSFHPRKLISTGDGGMLTTANAEWDSQFRLWRQHGMSAPDTVRHGARDVVFETYPVMGYNYRLTDIQAAVGREQLKRLPAMLVKRRALVERYRYLLARVPGVSAPSEPAWARSNWQSIAIRLPDSCDQRIVMQRMLDAGVATRRGIMNAHRESAYPPGTWSCGAGPGPCGCGIGSCARLSESERAQDRAILLPLHQDLTEADQDRVVAALADGCRQR